MIVLDILNNIFEILPELILGAGPFCVFKGMGTGKDSGKLLFKKIYTDGGLSITEDANSLDLSASGISNTAVCLRKISFGCLTGNGLTSSVFASVEGLFPQCDSVQCISIIGGTANCNYVGINGVNQELRTSIIIGGDSNKIKQGPGHVIVGGYNNYIKSQCQNSIISSDSSLIDNSICSSVLSSKLGKIYDSCSSAILSSQDSKIYNSRNSSIFGNVNKIRNGKFTTIFGLSNESLSTETTFISGYKNCGSTASNTSIINGRENNFYSPFCTFESSIVNGFQNIIKGASQSVVLNGSGNKITNVNMTNKRFVTFQSSILNGTNNSIIVDDDDPLIDKYAPSGRNVIANGKDNCIDKSIGKSVIMNGNANKILNSNSTIFNGFKNTGGGGTIIHSKGSISNSNDVIFSQGLVINCGFNSTSTIIVPTLPYKSGNSVRDISDLCSINLRNSVIGGNQNGIILGCYQLPIRCFDNSYYAVNLNLTPPIPPFLIGPPWGATISKFATASINNIVFGNTIFTPVPRGEKGKNIGPNIIGSFTASENELNRRVLLTTNTAWKSTYGVPQILRSQPPQIAAYSSSFTPKFGFTISSYYSYYINNSSQKVITVEGYCFGGTVDAYDVEHFFARNSIISQQSCIGRASYQDFQNKTVSGCYAKLSYNNILKGIKVSNSVIIGGCAHRIEPKVSQSAILGGTNHCMVRAINSVIVAGNQNKLDGWCEADQLSSSDLLNFSNVVILGGNKNCGRIKPLKDSCAGTRNSVIIGGDAIQFAGNNRVVSQNLALYCCLSYYNFATSTKSDGISATKTGTINSITVCNGIITNLS